MATSALIPVEEYLRTSYRPDCDYIDGEVRERNLGERPHSLLQGILYRMFDDHCEEWRLHPLLEQRVQVSSTRFRVPDLCLVRPEDGNSPIVRRPPVLCVEILSKEDTIRNMAERIADYFDMGVEAVWVIDPVRQEAVAHSKAQLSRTTTEVTMPQSPVRINLAGAFAKVNARLEGGF